MIAHSGGARGTDSFLSDIFSQHKYNVIHHSFKDRVCYNNTGKIIIHSQKELDKQESILDKLCHHVIRTKPKKQYVKNLLLSSIFQVKDSELIIGVGEIQNFKRGIIKSGTGYPVAYGILNKIPILFLDQVKEEWYYSLEGSSFEKMPRKPLVHKLPKNITITGTKDLTIDAMKELRNCFSKRTSNVQVCSHNNGYYQAGFKQANSPAVCKSISIFIV